MYTVNEESIKCLPLSIIFFIYLTHCIIREQTLLMWKFVITYMLKVHCIMM